MDEGETSRAETPSTESRSVDRRSLFKGAAYLALGSVSARGVYQVLGDFVRPESASAATIVRRRQEQYLVEQVEVIVNNGQTVAIPPVFNDVFTARLSSNVSWTSTALKGAKTRLENALVAVESPYPATASGLTMVIGWGLPYFRGVLPETLSDGYLPAIPGGATKQFAVLDAVRFASDPATLVLENNHVMFKLRSDSQSILQGAESALFENQNSGAYIGDLFDLTSKRMGFLGRGFGKESYGRVLAKSRGVAVADKIPPNAQLMMGFTSTQTQALGPDNIPSFETLRGVTDQWPNGYFAAGCAMHLSHLYLDLDSWYAQSYDDRVKRMFSPRTSVPADATTVTIPNGPAQVAPRDQVIADAAAGKAGHNSLLQQATRLGADALDNYGRLRRKGTPVPLREDFNTLDDPFAWVPGDVAPRAGTRPGMHFVAFVPGHHLFHRARNAMDGLLPDGTRLPVTAAQTGINVIMQASHRQNYVIPPRKNRSFPLAEYLS